MSTMLVIYIRKLNYFSCCETCQLLNFLFSTKIVFLVDFCFTVFVRKLCPKLCCYIRKLCPKLSGCDTCHFLEYDTCHLSNSSIFYYMLENYTSSGHVSAFYTRKSCNTDGQNWPYRVSK